MASDTGIIFSTISNLESGKQRMTYALISKFMIAYPKDFVSLDQDQKLSFVRRMKDEVFKDFPADILNSGIGKGDFTASSEAPPVVKITRFDRRSYDQVVLWDEGKSLLPDVAYYYTCEEQLVDPESHIVLEMVGDSMSDLIGDGSLILCKVVPLNRRDFITNGYFALIHDNQLSIGWVKENEGATDFMILYSRNINYAPVRVKRKSIHRIWKVIKIVSQELTQ